MVSVSPSRIGGFEADILDQPLHHRMQAARADILDLFVDLAGEAGDFGDALFGEIDRDALGRHQGGVLLDQAGFRLHQNSRKVVLGQRVELDPNGQASLEFR